MTRTSKTTLAWLSLLVSIVALGLKYLAWKASGSQALFSDAIETIINVVAALGALWALNVASRPADENHTYGHDKAEYLSAVVEGVLVTLTALAIFVVAWRAWQHPSHDLAPWKGLAINFAAGLLNLAWAIVLTRAGRAQRSPALIASGKHVLSDVWTTAGLVAGIALIPLTGYAQIDAILSALIALNVLRAGFEMMQRSISGLMDEAPDSETLQQIRSVIAMEAEGAIEAHDLRARTVGATSFIEFHLVVPGAMTVEAAHEICDRIETSLRARIGRSLIHIHVEPEEKAKHHGILVLS